MIARLADTLLRESIAILPALDEPARDAALFGLDGFLARPSPSSFLAALRVLREARSARAQATLAADLADARHARGLARLRAVASLDEATLAELATVEVDPRSGQRLYALAALREARDQLRHRVDAQLDAMRRQLALPLVDEEPPRPPRRRTRR